MAGNAAGRMIVRRAGLSFLLIVVTLVSAGVAGVQSAAACAPEVSTVAQGQSAPDDVSVRAGRVLVSDVTTGTVSRLARGRLRTIASGFSVPEGIVDRGRTIVVAEQERNRLVSFDMATHTRHVVLQLANATGQEGVDGIASGPAGSVLVPNSPYGTLLRLERNGTLQRLAGGMTRPTDAVPYRGGIAIADELGNAVWLERGGKLTLLARLSEPDDVAVFHGALLAVTLVDHGLWEVAPTRRLLTGNFAQPQGLAVQGNAVLVADSTRDLLERVTGVRACTG